MPPRKKFLIPPEARGTPRRNVKPISRFGADDSDSDDDDDMPLGQSRLLAAEARLVQGPMIERCRAVLDLMQLRPDAFVFAKPVSVADVPDYLDIIDNPCDYSTVKGKLDQHVYGEDHLSFASDMRRIFMNACKYNWRPDHEIHIAARNSLQAFEGYFARMLGNSSKPPAPRPNKSDGGSAPGQKRSHPRSTSSSGGEPKRPRVVHADTSERSVQLLRSLGEYLEHCGGSASMVDGWHTTTEYRKEGATAGTYDTYFFSPSGKRFRSRAEIARFFKLEAAPPPRAPKNTDAKQVEKNAAKELKQAQREMEREQALREKEKALQLARRYPVVDSRLPQEPPPNPPLGQRPPAQLPPNLGYLHPRRSGSLLQAWDFVRTVGGELQLPAYSVHELSNDLRPSQSTEPPQKLIELHTILLQSVLADEHAKSWWENPPNLGEKPMEVAASKSKQHKGVNEGGTKKRWWDMDAKPLVKCDIKAILASSEPGQSVRRWVAVLENVAPMRTNTGVPIRDAVELAIKCTREPEVKRYLNRALRYYKGNAAGTTKFAALWLAAQLRRNKPELWTHEAMQADVGDHHDMEAIEMNVAEKDAHEGQTPPRSPLNDDEELGEMDEDAAEAAATAALAEAGVEEYEDGVKMEGHHSYVGPESACPHAEGEEAPQIVKEEQRAVEGEEGSAMAADSKESEQDSEFEPPAKVDEHLWPGASAAGWHVQVVGVNGRKLGHWAYIGPSSSLYTSSEEAMKYKEVEAKRLDGSQLCDVPPELLIGWRVAVYWADDGEWYLGQVMTFNSFTGNHFILYDDQTQEDVNMSEEQYRLVYRLEPQFLSCKRRARRPEERDVTWTSWPLLAAACAVRWENYWPDPKPASMDLVEPESYADTTAAVAFSMGGESDATPTGQISFEAEMTIPDHAEGEAELLQIAIRRILSAHPTEVLREYCQLPAPAKLALINLVIDVACDTKSVTQAFDRILSKRHDLLSAHEHEDKETKRKAKLEKEELRNRLRVKLAKRNEEALEAADEPAQEEVTEAQVAQEMHRIAEAEACGVMGGAKVTVLSREALSSAEAEAAVTLELRSSGLDENGDELSLEEMRKNDLLRDEIRRRRDTLVSLREHAQDVLRSARESGKKADLEAAIHAGRLAAFEGHNDGVNVGHWVLVEMRDAYMALHDLKKHEGEELERARRREQLSTLSGRSDLLGIDRYGRRYWAFESSGDTDVKIWVQPRTEDVRHVLREDPPDASSPDAWQFFSGDEACLAIAASLDARGMRERALQSSLRSYVQLMVMRRRVAEVDAADEADPFADVDQEAEDDDMSDDDYMNG